MFNRSYEKTELAEKRAKKEGQSSHERMLINTVHMPACAYLASSVLCCRPGCQAQGVQGAQSFCSVSQEAQVGGASHSKEQIASPQELQHLLPLKLKAVLFILYRRIIFLVKAGAAVDATIDTLVPLLEEGDQIIDGGNEWYVPNARSPPEMLLSPVSSSSSCGAQVREH